MKALQLEFKKARPNQAVVAELMLSSFSLRRKDIVDNPQDLRTVLSKYPFLGQTSQVSVSAVCLYVCHLLTRCSC